LIIMVMGPSEENILIITKGHATDISEYLILN